MTLKKVVVDLKVEITPDNWTQRQVAQAIHREKDTKKAQKALQRWADDFEDFLRDHRSQDSNGLEVKEIYEYECEFCHDRFENFDSRPECCREAVEQYDKSYAIEVFGE